MIVRRPRRTKSRVEAPAQARARGDCWRPSRALGLALSATVLVAAPSALGETIFTGPGIYESTKRSMDIIGSHLLLLQAQNEHRKLLSYIGVTSRWAPGHFLLNDGRQAAGTVGRSRLNLGFGLGGLESWGVFAGADMDFVHLSLPVGWAGQSYLFAGLAVADLQITFASMQNLTGQRAFARDVYGNFQATADRGGGGGLPFRPGTPRGIAYPGDDSLWLHEVLSVYEDRTGAFAALVWANTPVYDETDGPAGPRSVFVESRYRLSEARLNLQPLRQLLPRDFGLPMLGFSRLDPLKDYYQQADAYRALATDPGTSAAPSEANSSAPYEIELGSDDVLAGGLRIHVVQELSPSVKFRRGELGVVEEYPLGGGRTFRFGARGVTYSRGDALTLSWDSYVQVAPLTGYGSKLHLAASYSYNSPDSTTFIPIPDAHVFGFQVVFGVPETSRPLIPLIRAVDERKKREGT